MLKKIPSKAAASLDAEADKGARTKLGNSFSILPNGRLKMASIKAAGSKEPEAYKSVR
jgi:hypothetical protein